ncbi:hypothetical protein [Micromonospora sp. SL4-19]|uniref:hypothetical protein n=1 Tax=Micromonospora sp. SL4-19 TaxID=3399129 RepID=UPI003A4DB1F3
MIELSEIDPAIEEMDQATRLHLMATSVEYVMFESRLPLSALFPPAANHLLRAAIDVVLTVPGPPPAELSDQVGPAPANMLQTAMDLLVSVADGAQVSTVNEVLFSCYDVAMQTQGLGRRITLEQQTASEICLDVIRRQKELVAGR